MTNGFCQKKNRLVKLCNVGFYCQEDLIQDIITKVHGSCREKNFGSGLRVGVVKSEISSHLSTN